MGLFGNLFSQHKAKERARKAGAQQEILAASTIEAGEAAQARRGAAESARFNVFTMLGAPGTYGSGSAGTGAPAGSTGTSAGIFDTSQQKSGVAKGLLNYAAGGKRFGEAAAAATEGTREGILNPEGYASELSKSAPFRIQSKLVADAEQLLNMEGPAWETLSNSTLGVIYEGAAEQTRETLRTLRNQAAKGGSARRQALNEANDLLARERGMRTRVQETWQANLKLHDYVRQNAERVQQGTGAFMDNLPQIRDSYLEAMDSNTRMLMAGNQLAAGALDTAYQNRAAVQDSNFWEKLIMAGITAAVGYVAGPGAAQGFTAGFNAGGETISSLGGKTYEAGKGFLGSLVKDYQVGKDLETAFTENPEIF